MNNQYNNIYKLNLDSIINWNSKKLISIKGNQLILDIYSFNFFKNILQENKNIGCLFITSFNHYLLLITINSNLREKDYIKFNAINYNEYKSNIINYLETCLKGLERYIDYNINLKDINLLKTIKEECELNLNTIKKNKLILNHHNNATIFTTKLSKSNLINTIEEMNKNNTVNPSIYLSLITNIMYIINYIVKYFN
tara:strand:+ start:274 stop:864 length:591 start_codon:yes stop_codon:yes gene_type:complete